MVLRHNTRPTRPSSLLPDEIVHLQELRDVLLEYLERRHLHGARAHRFERHGERLRVRQDHAAADEAHLRLRVLEFELELAFADERLAGAALDRRFERERDFAREVLVHVEREHVAVDARRELALRQTHEALELLLGVECVGELHLDLALVVHFDGIRLRDREFVERRDAPALRAFVGRQPRGSPFQVTTSSCSSLACARCRAPRSRGCARPAPR